VIRHGLTRKVIDLGDLGTLHQALGLHGGQSQRRAVIEPSEGSSGSGLSKASSCRRINLTLDSDKV
jgi:hypothetical protein